MLTNTMVLYYFTMQIFSKFQRNINKQCISKLFNNHRQNYVDDPLRHVKQLLCFCQANVKLYLPEFMKLSPIIQLTIKSI